MRCSSYYLVPISKGKRVILGLTVFNNGLGFGGSKRFCNNE